MNRVIYLVILSTLVRFSALGAAEVITFDNSWGDNPLFNVVSQSPTGVEIIFSLDKMVIEERVIDGVPMKSYGVPGIFLPNDEGAPDLAGTGRYIAVPRGASAELTILEARTEVYHDIEVAPAPVIPFDSDDSPLHYSKDMSIYGRDAYYPETPVKLSAPTKIRGVDVVILGITPFQHNPVTKELVVYRDIRVKVDFRGGDGHFGDDRLRSRFWEPVLQGHLLNYSSLPKIDFYSPERLNTEVGCEYVIIIPDDAEFAAWADTIKAWRNMQGISSDVFKLSEVGGADSASIKAFLQNAYSSWNPAPAAFLILSDYPSSGLTYGITAPHVSHPGGTMTSDNWYADFNGDKLPELHHARICAQSGTQLSTLINKFLSYERNPYTQANFYDNPLIACGWQTERWFQICAEVIRGFFVNYLDKNPARQYNIYDGNPTPGGVWSTATNTSTVVNYWYNVGWLYSINNEYNAEWWNSGSTAGITNNINAGAFLIQHRDHGSRTGWGEPDYHLSDLDNLTNTMFPFVYSTNCQTGWYDYYSETFAEKFHRISSGALGVNAATRNSYSFVNDTYIWGTYDGLWPDFDPGYPFLGMTGEDNLRPCMAMTHGKYYLQASSWPYNTNRKVTTYGLFHHLGDVFTTLYSEVPQELTVSHAVSMPSGQSYFSVAANEGSVIALTKGGEILGAAEGTGSPVSISIPSQAAGDTVLVTVTKANYIRYTAEVLVGCYYVPGDINGDGSTMGSDVTYGVRYFKGLGPQPVDSCWNDNGSSWLYSAGDANGNCTFQGSDITFMVAYFKGQNPAIFWCPQTPPAGGPGPLTGNDQIAPAVLPKE